MQIIKKITLFYAPITIFVALLGANFYHFDSWKHFYVFSVRNIQLIQSFFESITARQLAYNLFIFYAPIFVLYISFIYPKYKDIDFMNYRVIAKENKTIDLIAIIFSIPLMVIGFFLFHLRSLDSFLLIFALLIIFHRVFTSILFGLIRLLQFSKEENEFEFKSRIFCIFAVIFLICLGILGSIIF